MSLLRADARALPLAEASVQCVVTSPPYWGLRDYGTARWEDGDPACAHGGRPKPRHDTAASGPEKGQFAESRGTQAGKRAYAIPVREVCRCGARRVDRQIGLETTPADYVAELVDVFREVRRVLRPDGVLFLNLGDSYATGGYGVGDCPGGGQQGARWRGDVDRIRDAKRGYRGDRLDNGRGDQLGAARQKTRATRDGSHAGKHTGMAAVGPMTQPNRMPIDGLKPKDLVGIPWRVAFALQADGWYLRSDIIWSKPNPMPESVTDRPTKAHEYVFLLTKCERYHYDAAAVAEPISEASIRRYQRAVDNAETFDPARHKHGDSSMHNAPMEVLTRAAAGVVARGTRNLRSVWSIPTKPYAGAHFATMPELLVERCVLAGSRSGDLVFDPFLGSGTVARVAISLGRRAAGCDLNASYLDLARERTSVTRGLALEVEATA